MANEDALPKAHDITINSRERMEISGVEDVMGFDESAVILKTSLGRLSVRGENIHVEKIDLDSGLLELRGKLCELSYEDGGSEAGFWTRLFG